MKTIWENVLLDNDLIKSIIDNPFIGICVTDSNGICFLLNDIHSKISGMSNDNFLGKSMIDLADKNILSVSSTAEVLRTGKEVNIKQTNVGQKSYDVRGVPVYGEDGSIKYVVSYLLDVTEIQKSKSLIHKLEEDKEKAEEKIKRLAEAQRMDGEIVFCSDVMQRIINIAKKVASHDSYVLISGPSGSGKELIANIIHTNSMRRTQPFIKINCAAIPDQLLESELFGYEPGAFTGGNPKGQIGIFEAANGGSLLLDEIGAMPINLQAKLLRVLQNQEVRRIGSDRAVQVDVRIIASTNNSISELINNKRFRNDLFYRLNVVELEVPGLNKRKEDIPILVTHFIKNYNEKYNAHKTIHWDGIRYLMNRDYPGNVRELRNIVERILVQSNINNIMVDDVIEITDLIKKTIKYEREMPDIQGHKLKELMEAYERTILEESIKIYDNAETASKHLGIDRSTMSRKLYKYNLK